MAIKNPESDIAMNYGEAGNNSCFSAAIAFAMNHSGCTKLFTPNDIDEVTGRFPGEPTYHVSRGYKFMLEQGLSLKRIGPDEVIDETRMSKEGADYLRSLYSETDVSNYSDDELVQLHEESMQLKQYEATGQYEEINKTPNASDMLELLEDGPVIVRTCDKYTPANRSHSVVAIENIFVPRKNQMRLRYFDSTMPPSYTVRVRLDIFGESFIPEAGIIGVSVI